MIKNLLAFHFSLFIFNFSLAQSWVPVGGGLHAPVGGKGGVSSLCTYGDKLYAGGLFKLAGSLQVNNIASWDGTKWDSLKSGTNGCVEALFVFHNQLCVGGTFTQAGKKRVDRLAHWIDTANTAPDWYNLGATFVSLKDEGPSAPNFYAVGPFAEYHDRLYVAGAFGYPGCAINHVGVLNNGKWTYLSSTKCSVNGDTIRPLATASIWNLGTGLAVYNDKLFATGTYVIIDRTLSNWPVKAEDVASWDDKKSSVNFLTPKNYSSPYASCLTIYTSQLYAAGVFADGNKELYKVAFWDNDHWSPLPDAPNSEVRAMIEYDGKLYVGGGFDSAGGKPAKAIAVWDGHTWSAVGKGFTDHGHVGSVDTFVIYNGELYAGGSFNASGDQPLTNIAKLNLNGTRPAPTPPNKKQE
jgi:hypothetical protein